MSVVSERHDDLSTIHTIMLSQRQLAIHNREASADAGCLQLANSWDVRAETITDLLTELECAGVEWPSNVVELTPLMRQWMSQAPKDLK